MDQQWIGYAIVAMIVMFGNAIFQWWKGIQVQKHGQQLDDFKVVVDNYKDQLTQRDYEIRDIKKEMSLITRDHQTCIAALSAFKVRVEFSEKTILTLTEKIHTMEVSQQLKETAHQTAQQLKDTATQIANQLVADSGSSVKLGEKPK